MLLIYRKLKNIQNGFVSVEDLSALSSFQGLQPKFAGRYLSNRLVEQTAPYRKLVRESVNVSTVGPYKLLIDASDIDTDLTLLDTYFQMKSMYIVDPLEDSDPIWDEATKCYFDSDFKVSYRLFDRFTNLPKRSNENSIIRVILAKVRMAEIEFKLRGNRQKILNMLNRARRLCTDIKDSNLSRMLYSVIIGVEVMTVKTTKDNYKKLLRLNNKALSLIDELPDSPDKLSIKAGRLYYSSYLSLRHSEEDENESNFNKSIELHDILSQLESPKLHRANKGIIESTVLQRNLIILSKRNTPAGSEEIDIYNDILVNKRTVKSASLNLGFWIRHTMKKAGRINDVIDFTSECLYDHADQHDTNQYSEMLRRHRELRNKISCSGMV